MTNTIVRTRPIPTAQLARRQARRDSMLAFPRSPTAMADLQDTELMMAAMPIGIQQHKVAKME
jgi:hypothetical protein